MDAREANEVRITELEESITTLTQRSVERETELERFDLFSPLLFFPVVLLWSHEQF